jgi:1D-myo-inositol 3-kinase
LNRALQFDYISIGHVTVDVLEDGERRPGGTALYAGLQAARLGLRTMIITRGLTSEIEGMLEPWAGELDVRIQAAPETTTFATTGQGAAREQRLTAWAGPIEPEGPLSSAILHLAPVAAELPPRWPEGGRLLGLTPQGLARSWPAGGGPVRASAPPSDALAQAEQADAVVISEHEHHVCGELLERARAGGALVVITAGEDPSTILGAGPEALEVPVTPVEGPAEDLGAGDVYAAAFFTALAEGRKPAQAAALANASAALRMTGIGAEAIARRPEIEARLSEST